MNDELNTAVRGRMIELIDAALEGEQSDEEARELGRLVESDPVAARFYTACLADAINLRTWAGGLRWADDEGGGPKLAAPHARGDTHEPDANNRSVPSGAKRFQLSLPAMAIVATALLIGGIGFLAFNQRGLMSGGQASSGEPSVWLANQIEPSWEGDRPMLGRELGVGRELNLRSGFAEIRYRNGAVVVLEGPVRFRVGSETDPKVAGRLGAGKLVAQCGTPGSHGLVIDTAYASVIDLGTSFGVEVNEPGTVKVGVFSGTVEVVGKSSAGQTKPPLRLATNQGCIFTNGTQISVPNDSVVQEFRDAEMHLEAARGVNRSFIGPLTGDTATSTGDVTQMAYWKLDGNVVDDLGGHTGELKGSLRYVPGKFGQAAEFDGVDDYIPCTSTQLPLTNFTMAGWVLSAKRINGDAYLFGTQRSRLGGVFLRVGKNAKLRLTCVTEPNQVTEIDSGDLQISLDTWTHVAVTLHAQAGLSLYVNGRLVDSSVDATKHVPVGNFTIGRRADRPDVHRSFCFWSGRIDDLAVWNQPLTGDQIRTAMRSGSAFFNE